MLTLFLPIARFIEEYKFISVVSFPHLFLVVFLFQTVRTSFSILKYNVIGVYNVFNLIKL